MELRLTPIAREWTSRKNPNHLAVDASSWPFPDLKVAQHHWVGRICIVELARPKTAFIREQSCSVPHIEMTTLAPEYTIRRAKLLFPHHPVPTVVYGEVTQTRDSAILSANACDGWVVSQDCVALPSSSPCPLSFLRESA